MDLFGDRFLAPEGSSSTIAAALPLEFVAAQHAEERAAFALLGVRQPNLARLYR